MLQYGNYDVLEFSPPAQGMNVNVIPDLLGSQFSPALENILPFPLGEGAVRYGTEFVAKLSSFYDTDIQADSIIIEAFPFRTLDGNQQMLLYVKNYVQDQSVIVKEFHADFLKIETKKSASYSLGTTLKIQVDNFFYYEELTSVVKNLEASLDLQFFASFLKSEPAQIWTGIGDIYCFDMVKKSLTKLTKGLSGTCIPRAVTFMNKLVICNGVDPVVSWNGANLETVVDFVKETGAIAFVRGNDQSFSFSLQEQQAGLFDADNYTNKKINLVGTWGTFPTTVLTVTQTLNAVTFTTADTLPVSIANANLFYAYQIPTFSNLFVAYQRLWALGPGVVGDAFRKNGEQMKVYYAYGTNSVTKWVNEVDRTVHYLDLSSTHGRDDNLETITCVNGQMTFIGRECTQVWSGSQPAKAEVAPNLPTLQFASTLPVGIAHGNLILDIGNDVFFISKGGLLSFGTLNIAKQLAVSTLDAVNPLIKKYLNDIRARPSAYLACRSFNYTDDAFCGFKIGFNKVLTSLVSTYPYAWSLFSGDFTFAQSFLTGLDSSLYLFVENSIFRYANGKEGQIIYGDNGGKSAISFLWAIPPFFQKGRRFANKRYELQCDYSSDLFLSPLELNVTIDGDLIKTFSLSDRCNLPYRGDIFESVPQLEVSNTDDPNNPTADALGFRLDEPHVFLKKRLKFLSSHFMASVSGLAKNGRLSFAKLRLFGIMERG